LRTITLGRKKRVDSQLSGQLSGNMRGNVLVTFAVEAELAPWRRMRSFRRLLLGKFYFYHTRIGHAEVFAVLTGVGARAAGTANAVALEYKPQVAIVAGTAAGLGPELRPGDVLVAESVYNVHQTETAHSDPGLFHHALQCGARPVRRFLTVAQMLHTPEAKSGLSHMGDAAEMESLAIMRLLSHEGTPVVAVRVVSEAKETRVPCDFERTLDSLGQLRLWRLFPQVARRPWVLPDVIRFGLTGYRATMILARFLDRFVERLCAGHSVQEQPPAVVTT
jgi:adenosylhomocysteine nucleosidase